jgi:hypothetical protein
VTVDPGHAFQDARDAYLAEHPLPDVTDFTCPTCSAPKDVPCRKTIGHVTRQQRQVRAAERIRAAAVRVGERALDAALTSALRQ